ncbi:MAG: FeoA family protein [Saprospiraceae bacterium]|nr:FeoA family protein [Saprospiraceae bacterium]|tara:strand:- start:5507 stop:5746 length:240 start_codon:yes stop_codon:yes gene_type:complete
MKENGIILRTILDLKPGEEGTVQKFNESSLACNLLTLGVLPETKIKMVRKSPMGNAVCLKLGDYLLAVRKSQASKIIIH